MIDRQTVCRRLQGLETYTMELERLASTLSRSTFDAELRIQWMVEHGLQLAIECILDIGNHPVAGEQLGTPQSDREVIELLGESAILPADFVGCLACQDSETFSCMITSPSIPPSCGRCCAATHHSSGS